MNDDSTKVAKEASCHQVPMGDTPVRTEAENQVAAFMLRLFTLPRQDFEIIRRRFLEPDTPLRVIARRYGLTTQAVQQRLKTHAATWPAVRALVGLKLERRKKD